MFARFRRHQWDEHHPKYIPVKRKPFKMPVYKCLRCEALITIEKEWRPELKAARYGCQPHPTLFEKIRKFLS